GTNLELVRVLRSPRERLDVDEIAADLVGERLEIGDGRHHPDLVLGDRGRVQRSDDRESGSEDYEGGSHGRCLLERVGRMGAENERGLEEELVYRASAAAVEVEGLAGLRGALRVLVGQAEAEELRRPERDVGLDRPFHPRVLWVL